MTSQASSKQAYNMRYLVRIRKEKPKALQRVLLKDTSAFRHMILSVLKIITIKVTIINTQGYDFSQKLSLSSVTAKVSLQALIQGKKVQLYSYLPYRIVFVFGCRLLSISRFSSHGGQRQTLAFFFLSSAK